jgi:hypothetical protein
VLRDNGYFPSGRYQIQKRNYVLCDFSFEKVWAGLPSSALNKKA